MKTCLDLRANLISTKVSASHRKSMQVRASSGQTESQVDSSFQLLSTRESQKTHFKADISCISLASNRLMDVTQLASSWVGWPNGKKLALTCVQI